MDSNDGHSKARRNQIVELTRVQPIEAEVIAARLRASGIPATLGPDSVYPSLSFTEGVPIFVPMEDATRARALLEDEDDPVP
jgi:Putative prokaryotic signal transducing protein